MAIATYVGNNSVGGNKKEQTFSTTPGFQISANSPSDIGFGNKTTTLRSTPFNRATTTVQNYAIASKLGGT